MNIQQRSDVLAYRKLQNLPLHSPPHFEDGYKSYLITAAIYEHKNIMSDEKRRKELQEDLIEKISEMENSDVYAWVIMQNHYHILVKADLFMLQKTISRIHNGFSTRWNREDKMSGRKVWHRFSDRHIRSDAHYWASVNYVHMNPVKHNYVSEPSMWLTSSFCDFQKNIGKEKMASVLQSYPIDKMGVGWDD
jgi:putative transposase